MNEQKPEGLPAGEIVAPILPERPPFVASRRECLAALALYPLAWLYVRELPRAPIWLAVFTLGLVALTELLYRGRPRARESWFWLGCLALAMAGLLLRDGARDQSLLTGSDYVWYYGEVYFFLHLFAVWWVLSRGGALLEGRSGHLLPMDALNGFIIFPFKHFFLRVRSLWYGLTHLRRPGGKARPAAIAWTLAAVALAVLLFLKAVELLMQADAGFAALLEHTAELFGDWPDLLDPDLLLSLPVGAWLFGLLAGSAREDREALSARGERLRRRLETLRRVPAPAWLVVCVCFCLLYLVFFVVQARYLFGAFTRTLPEGFIVSEYARRGFFELCRVMAVNFALLWLITRLAAVPVRQSRSLRPVCLMLLGESLLLAVVAFSKLALYIDCFGFTPLRLQSCWGVTALAAGCLCAGYSLLSGKRSFRAWLFFSAGSLALLCLV